MLGFGFCNGRTVQNRLTVMRQTCYSFIMPSPFTLSLGFISTLPDENRGVSLSLSKVNKEGDGLYLPGFDKLNLTLISTSYNIFINV